jgi:inorganic triphosphatase YgiF
MTTPKALEIKLEVAPKSLHILEKIPLIHSLRGIQARHRSLGLFRYPQAQAPQKGLLLRVHSIGHRYTQTIKAGGNSRLFEREEWEAQFGGAQPDLRR